MIPRWVETVMGLFVLAVALVVVAAPGMVATRLTAGTLPSTADLAYASKLWRYVGAVAVGAVGGLMLWRRVAPTFCARDWGRWTIASSIALNIAAALSMWWYVDDDAGISFTFARNLAEGRGLVFNIGEPPIEGYSNPLWVFILAAASLLHLDIVLAAKMLSLLFSIVCLLVMWKGIRSEPVVAWLALPIAATNASLIVWSSSCLENALHMLLITSIIVLVPNATKRTKARWLLVAVLCALVLSRPEGAMFAPAIALLLGLRALRDGDSPRPAVMMFVVPMLVLTALLVFRELYFGDPLPNTFYAKASGTNPFRIFNPFSGGWLYVTEAAAGCGWTVGLVPLLIVLAMPKQWSPVVPAAITVIAVQLFFVISVGGDWMKEFRFVSPIVPAMSILIGLGLARTGEILSVAGMSLRSSAAVCLLLAGLMMLPQIHRLIMFAYEPTTPLSTVAAIGQYFKKLGEAAGIKDPTLLHHDAGGTSFVANIRLIDLAGLCDPVIAHHWKDRERMREYIFSERRPDFIYSGPTFARRIGLERFEEFQTDYLPLPPAPSPELDGYIRRVRKDLYPKLFHEKPPADGERAPRSTD